MRTWAAFAKISGTLLLADLIRLALRAMDLCLLLMLANAAVSQTVTFQPVQLLQFAMIQATMLAFVRTPVTPLPATSARIAWT